MRGGNGVKNRACEWKPLLGLLQLSALQLQNEIRSNAINETNKFIGGDIVGQSRRADEFDSSPRPSFGPPSSDFGETSRRDERGEGELFCGTHMLHA